MNLFLFFIVFLLHLTGFYSTASNTFHLRKMDPMQEVGVVAFKMEIPGVPVDRPPAPRDIAAAEEAIMKAYNQVNKRTDFEMIDAHVTNVGPDRVVLDASHVTGTWSDWYLFVHIACNICGPADDDRYHPESEVSVLDSPGALGRMRAVERVFCRVLVKDLDYPYFDKIHDCTAIVRLEADNLEMIA